MRNIWQSYISGEEDNHDDVLQQIASEIPEKLGEMTLDFSLLDFFRDENMARDNYIGAIIVTKSQVISAYMPTFDNKRILHEDAVINPILKQANISDEEPRLAIRINTSEKKDKFALVYAEKPQSGEDITPEMKEIMKNMRLLVNSIDPYHEYLSFASFPRYIKGKTSGENEEEERIIGIKPKVFMLGITRDKNRIADGRLEQDTNRLHNILDMSE